MRGMASPMRARTVGSCREASWAALSSQISTMMMPFSSAEVFADGVEVAGWQLADEAGGAEQDLDEFVSFAGLGG